VDIVSYFVETAFLTVEQPAALAACVLKATTKT